MKPILSLLSVVAGLTLMNSATADETKPVPKQSEFATEDTTEPAKPATDPFSSAPAESEPSAPIGIPAARLKENRPGVHLRLETWQVPANEITRKLDAGQSPSEVAKWRDEWLGKAGDAQLMLSPAISVDASTRMKTESIREIIYPTEYTPPELLPKEPAAKVPETASPELTSWLATTLTNATPTAFETRNTGTTLEAVGMPVATEKDTWDMLTSVEDVSLLGFSAYGPKDMHIEMPCFSSFRTGGLTRLRTGEWRLLSVMSSPGNIDQGRSKDRWVTLIRIDPVK